MKLSLQQHLAQGADPFNKYGAFNMVVFMLYDPGHNPVVRFFDQVKIPVVVLDQDLRFTYDILSDSRHT